MAPEMLPPERTSPQSALDEIMNSSAIDANTSHDGHEDRSEKAHGTPIDDKEQGLVSRLLSTRGHLSFDQLSGRLRYYGPTSKL